MKKIYSLEISGAWVGEKNHWSKWYWRLNGVQSTRKRFLDEQLVSPLLCPLVAEEKYSNLAMGSVLMVLEPLVQFAGQTSPCVSYS